MSFLFATLISFIVFTGADTADQYDAYTGRTMGVGGFCLHSSDIDQIVEAVKEDATQGPPILNSMTKRSRCVTTGGQFPIPVKLRRIYHRFTDSDGNQFHVWEVDVLGPDGATTSTRFPNPAYFFVQLERKVAG
tara:strand:+ start:251 stop:652 length:402 start_codon:yes stop_codon:yes gene_type:complete